MNNDGRDSFKGCMDKSGKAMNCQKKMFMLGMIKLMMVFMLNKYVGKIEELKTIKYKTLKKGKHFELKIPSYQQ